MKTITALGSASEQTKGTLFSTVQADPLGVKRACSAPEGVCKTQPDRFPLPPEFPEFEIGDLF